MSRANIKPMSEKTTQRKLSVGSCKVTGDSFKRHALAAAPPKFILGVLFNGLLQGNFAAVQGKETCSRDSKERGNLEHSNCESIGTGNFLPWVDRAWMTVLGIFSQKGLSRQVLSRRRSESDPPDDQSFTGRKVRTRIKCKEIPFNNTWRPSENHLLVSLLDNLSPRIFSSQRKGSDRSGASFCGGKFSGVFGKNGEDATLEMLSMSFLLQEHPSLSTRLAQKLGMGSKRSGRPKPSMLGFARVGGQPQMVGASNSDCKMKSEASEAEICTPLNGMSQDQARGSFIPVPSVSLKGILDFIPRTRSVQQTYPDKQKLDSVQDFFRYTETEGRRLFEELDRDRDGQITLEDLKVAMLKRKLPSSYAQKFLRGTQTNWLAKSFGWNEFRTQIHEKEPLMLRLFNSLNMSKSGTLQKSHVKALLQNAGLPATDGSASAMMDFLGVDAEGSIKYGQFRKFMMLLPTKQLLSDPWTVWFQAATTNLLNPKVTVLEPTCSLAYVDVLFAGLACHIETMKAVISVIPSAKSFSKFTGIGSKDLLLEQRTNHIMRIENIEASQPFPSNAAPEIYELQPLSSPCKTTAIPEAQNAKDAAERHHASSYSPSEHSHAEVAQQHGSEGLVQQTTKEALCLSYVNSEENKGNVSLNALESN